MGLEYFIFYAEANLICILILLMILINDRIHRAQEEKQICFNRTIIAFILYFSSDMGWAAVLGGQLPRTRAFVVLFNLTNYVILSLITFEWFMFMAASEKMPFRKDRTKRMLWRLPMIVSILFLIISYALNPYFWINENGDLNSLYFPCMIAAPVLYVLTSFVFSIVNAIKTESEEDRKYYRLIGTFPIGVMAFGLIQVYSLNAPTFCFGCTFMLLFFYIQDTQRLISVDALTRLNNRGQINRYMEQLHYRENSRIFIMMTDIDRFKQINDTYGHAEGDRALIIVSETLKRVCEGIKAPAFLGRYGGDEFIIIIQNPEEGENPEQIADLLRNTLSERCRSEDLPYALNLSIGYEKMRGRNDTAQNCLIRADKKLYKEKSGHLRHLRR